MVRYAISIFLVVALVGIATLMLSVNLVPEPVILAVQYIPTGSQAQGDNTIIVRLDVGEFIGNELTAVGEGQLPALRSGNVHGKEISTSYTQAMRFSEPGLFNGGSVQFGRDEQNRVTDFLQFNNGDAIFKYQIEFAPGLRSVVEGNHLPDIEDEDISLMGERFSIVDTRVNTGSNNVQLKLFGGFGSIEFEDNYADDVYTNNGAKINGQAVAARVKIKASLSGDTLTIYSIHYILDANAVRGGNVYVLPLHCVREYLQYPTGLLSANFDICYKGLSAPAAVKPSAGISGNEVRMRPAGDDEYTMYASNSRGRVYQIPVAQNPGMYGNKGRNFVFVEAPNAGAPNINEGDYFLVNSKNDVNGVSNVLRYDRAQAGVLYFQDLSGGDHAVSLSGNEGDLLIGEGTYHVVLGAGNALAMDQTNDGQINGGEARFVFAGGTRIDFGPGFVLTVTTPQRLFSDPAGDENSQFNIVFGGDIDLNVPSPQVTVPGYTFELQGLGGGVKQGMTKYGILYTWDTKSGHSDDLSLVIPGAYVSTAKSSAGADVYITMERQRFMKPLETPAPVPKCGDRIITKPEYCDPPGSACADQFRRSGVCSEDCSMCTFIPKAQCGNGLLEKGEACEATADCPQGFMCSSCACVAIPAPVCGNNLIEGSEQCEADVDCGLGYKCAGCSCLVQPQIQTPAQVREPNVFVQFWNWLKSLFGR